MKIRLMFRGGSVDGELNDSEAATEFLGRLPLTLRFEDYAATEKIAYLPEKLLAPVSKGYQPKKGDITYYAPWGNLAIFYKDFSYAQGLVSLGEIEGDPAQLSALDGREVTIEQV